jgi:Zn-dependent protease with chaperone function
LIFPTLVSCGIILVAAILAPHLARVLWKTTALEDGPLRRQIEALGARAQVPLREILVVGGAAGARPNARLLGLTARTRCLLLSSSLLERRSSGLLEAAVAHELGHVRKHHPPYCLLSAAALLAGSYRIPEMLSGFLGGPFAALSLLPLALSSAALLGWIWRRFELEADLEASAVLGARRYEAALCAGLSGSPSAARGTWFHPPLELRRRHLAAIGAEGPCRSAFRAAGFGLRGMIVALFLALSAAPGLW